MNTMLQRRYFGELRNNLEVNLVRDRFLVVITSGQEACTYRLSHAEAKELATLIINNLEEQERSALRTQLMTDNDYWYVIQQQD